MGTALHQELFHSPPFGGCEKQVTRIAVVEADFRLALGFLYEVRLFEVSRVLCVVAIEVANSVCCLPIGPPSEIALNGNLMDESRQSRWGESTRIVSAYPLHVEDSLPHLTELTCDVPCSLGAFTKSE
jgi:hypothetical protein